MQIDDLVEFEDDEIKFESESPTSIEKNAWSLLVVDDEEVVHSSTKYALTGLRILGRKVVIDDAYSSAEAKVLLNQKKYACILLDVVMETDNSGLELVEYIRNHLNDNLVRIILRTGQPGYAPESEVIEKYDINDYKAKSELTAMRLSTSLIASLRTYEQIQTIDNTRQGLEVILEAASNLLQKKAVHQFGKGALIQICSLLKIKNESLLVVSNPNANQDDSLILAATGQFEDLSGQSLERLGDKDLMGSIQRTLENKVNLYSDQHSILFISSPHGVELIIYLCTVAPLEELDKRLLEIFTINIAIGYDNASMFEKVETLAFVDALTELPNKTSFEQQISNYMQEHQQIAVLLLDVDNFQAINDGLGHTIGDQVLKLCATQIKNIIPKRAYLARISSDIFGLILPYTQIAEVEKLLFQLKIYWLNALLIQHYQISITMCVGVALCPVHDSAPIPLMQKAGIALKQAKTHCRGSCKFFDQTMEDSLIKRLNIISDLHHCIEKQQLRLYYQPKMDLVHHGIRGVEALIRWQNEEILVPPDAFIPAAESSGHIIEIGEWVLKEACRQHCRWRDQLNLTLHMAVNVSVRQLQDPGFLNRLEHTINETGIDPKYLELEVTESMMSNDLEINNTLIKVREKGVTVSIDDFGTGYSCLSTLQNLPVDCLKVDKSFTQNMFVHPDYITIIKLIINLAHQLRLRVVAEGLESAEQEKILLEMGCDLVQGYRYSKPVVPAQLERLIAENDWYHLELPV